MIAILLAPVYLLANYYLLRRVMGWVKAWFPFFRTARSTGRVPAALCRRFWRCSIVHRVFRCRRGGLRRVMKLIGNYWLGVLLYLLLAVLRGGPDCGCCCGPRVCRSSTSLRSAQMHRIAGCLCAAGHS